MRRLLRGSGADAPLPTERLDELLARTGGDPAVLSRPAPPDSAGTGQDGPRTATRTAPRKGRPGPYAGRAANLLRPAVHRASTAQLQGVYPWLHGAGLPPVGAYIGVNTLTRSAFSCHPIEWLLDSIVTNPNLLITGIPGAGKSATIKALMFRMMAFGVKSFVVGDIKNEYAPLARFLGVEPVELGPGLTTRLNPLDAGPLGHHLPRDPDERRERLAEVHRRRLTLLATLLVMRIGRPLTPTEEAFLSYAVRLCSGETPDGGRLVDPTLPEVYRTMRDPDRDAAADLRVRGDDVQELRELTRDVTYALGNMITGSLGGLFDAPTTTQIDFDAPIQTVDLSRIDGRGDDTVAMVLACVSSWGQAAIDQPGAVRMVIRDELWRSMRIPALIKKVDSDLRLSRSQGTIQVLATHRLADFEAVGAAGSEDVNIAKNLIASCDTRIQLAQDTAPLRLTREAIGLTDAECAHIGSWGAGERGRALWKVGRAGSFPVQLILSPLEQRLFWTNERMAV